MDNARRMRIKVWDGLSVLLLAALFGITAFSQFDRVFLFCVVVGVYLILFFSIEVMNESPIAYYAALILTAVLAVCLVILSNWVISFIFCLLGCRR